ncbi:hypothetical protein GIW81_08390 [Hyphomicrobium sp. xq]|uniref:Patatin-like phospholipase n=1 Tax=Hyphomicrobium album TaxID=2665159 RepID=A0A6I3KNR5_9HYPH|nr:hypothetical protein [Hyphomicrobium album]MTD94351.1 hypothetical protein [Hyphomicrobium album]
MLILNHARFRLWHCRLSLLSLLAGAALILLVPQIQDLFLERLAGEAAAAYALILLAFWAIPVHLAARHAVSDMRTGIVEDRAEFQRWAQSIDLWLPRLLGLLPFAIVALGLRGASAELDGLGQLKEAKEAREGLRHLSWAVAGSALAYIGYIALRHLIRIGRMPTQGLLADSRLSDWIQKTYALIAMLMFFWAFFWPLDFTATIGRAALLPVLLGAWLPFLTPLAIVSQRWHWPLVATAVALAVLLSSLNTRFHDVRVYESPHWLAAQLAGDAKRDPAAARQALLAEALDKWRGANDCKATVADCPRVMLVAAQGGASRAAFLTATVLGALLDATRAEPSKYGDIGRRIFAMSGASGGSVGLALTRAALAEGHVGQTPPCGRGDPMWFANESRDRDPTKSWRACLQVLAAGDFLSPTVAGLFLRDNIAIPSPAGPGTLYPDRAVLLEHSLERHYNGIVHGDPTPCGEPKDERGLCRAVGYLGGHETSDWLPLLFLNATSVDTGRPIVASEIELGDSGGASPAIVLYPFSLNVFELLSAREFDNPADEVGRYIYGLERAPDLRLSTAAVLSSRFPVISPSGQLRRGRGQLTARAVDGGYYDNTGLHTLQPIIDVLIDRGLRVSVVYLTNDAWDYEPGLERRTNRDAYWYLPGRPWASLNNRVAKLSESLLSRLSVDPLQTLNAARTERAELLKDDLSTSLTALGEKASFREIRVSQHVVLDDDDVSGPLCIDKPGPLLIAGKMPMNWWLSPVVQRLLDAQMCAGENDVAIQGILSDLEKH